MDNVELLKAITCQFDKFSMQIDDKIQVLGHRLDNIEQKQQALESRFNERFDNFDHQLKGLKQEVSELKQNNTIINEDDDEDMEVVISEPTENFTQSEELVENNSPSPSFTTIDIIVQKFSTIEVNQQNKLSKSKSTFPVNHNKTMVMIAIFLQLGTQYFSHLIPIVVSVTGSIWGCNTFKFFDPGGQQNFLRALAQLEYVQTSGVLSFLEYIQSRIQEREREERGSVALQLSATIILFR